MVYDIDDLVAAGSRTSGDPKRDAYYYAYYAPPTQCVIVTRLVSRDECRDRDYVNSNVRWWEGWKQKQNNGTINI